MTTVSGIQAGLQGIQRAIPVAAAIPVAQSQFTQQVAQAIPALVKGPVGAASKRSIMWGVGAAALALFSLGHPLTWPIAAVAGYFSYKNFKVAKALRALA